MNSRRMFLKSSAMAMFGIGAAPAWLSRVAYAQTTSRARRKILVAIFQRGAVDGLSMVVPHGEAAYYKLRPNLAIAKPGSTPDSAIDLDGFFGLHPALKSLKPLYDAKHLAIVNAAGSPDPTRSHFDAQDYMESGTPGLTSSDGWLNRAMLPVAKASPVRAISLGTDLARTLRGRNQAVAIDSLDRFQVRDPGGADTFESMYSGTLDKALNGTGREAFEAVHLIQSFEKEPYTPADGAVYPPDKFGQNLLQIARMIKANVGLEVAFTDVGGWDTHFNQVLAKPTQGRLPSLLTPFGQALAAFYTDLGARMADVSVVTMSEFGRTARENGSRGTDHGHANVMMVLGGGVNGGKIYGEWPGLEREQLYEQRDLSLTTDFRDVLGELVTHQLGNSQMTKVFPGYEHPRFRGLLTV